MTIPIFGPPKPNFLITCCPVYLTVCKPILTYLTLLGRIQPNLTKGYSKFSNYYRLKRFQQRNIEGNCYIETSYFLKDIQCGYTPSNLYIFLSRSQ